MPYRTPQVKLKPNAINWLKKEYGYKTDRALALSMGISAPLLTQIKNGDRGVSAAFLVGAYQAFGLGFDAPIYHIINKKA